MSAMLMVLSLALQQQGPVVSPEVKEDKTVTFRIRAPKAAEVLLNGEWKGGGKLAMTKDEQGVWSVTVGPLEPDLYGYSFSVDGMTINDPSNPHLATSFGAGRSVVTVPGAPGITSITDRSSSPSYHRMDGRRRAAPGREARSG